MSASVPTLSAPGGRLRSCMCTQAQLQSPQFGAWATALRESPQNMHRKLWEFCFVVQALHERGMLAPGRRGLGFAVGREPLPAYFASRGCEIVATDLATEEAEKRGWVKGDQHASSREGLNDRGICDPREFDERVTFRFVDMRRLPDDLGRFDFLWSSCSLEHLGDMAKGEKFIFESLRYLAPGGVAVHTTEYNLSSNWLTRTRGETVLFRRRDLERVAQRLRGKGYAMDLDLTEGRLPLDRIVDPPPYSGAVHLRLRLGWFTATSVGLLIEAPPAGGESGTGPGGASGRAVGTHAGGDLGR